MSEKDNSTKNYGVIEKAAEAIDVNILMPVHSRLKKRYKQLRELSSAKHTKIPMGTINVWKTEPPKMFVCGLSATMSNGVGVINYKVYKKDKTGNKEINKRYSVFTNDRGETRKTLVDANYVLEKIVIERIEFRKSLKKEEFKESEL